MTYLKVNIWPIVCGMNINIGKQYAGLYSGNSTTKKFMSVKIIATTIPVPTPCHRMLSFNFQSTLYYVGSSTILLSSISSCSILL